MRLSALIAAAFVLATACPASAHVGSPDTYYEGSAGPYKLFVTIKAPLVIPGVADVEVRSESSGVRSIATTITTLTGAGSNSAPTPDLAKRSQQDPQFFTSSLWLMQPGAMRVEILADGDHGKAEMSVPIASYAQTTLKMDPWLGRLLFVLMMLLGVGIVAIVGAAARESLLEAGATPTPRMRRASIIAGSIAAALVLLGMVSGGQWWTAEASTYANNAEMFKPHSAEVSIGSDGLMSIQLPPLTRPINGWVPPATINALIPDHGHLMHLFLIRTPNMDQVFHLHPDQKGDGIFTQPVPPGASGTYRIFADVVDATGLPWTLVGAVEIPSGGTVALSGDDSGATVPAESAASDTTSFPLRDGYRMVWLRDSATLEARVPTRLRFEVFDANGNPARDLQPYMGMAAHAAVVKSDFTVFAHLHPGGSVPMASLELVASRSGDSSLSAMPNMAMPNEPIDPTVTIPYGFPQPGAYRIFVQVKRADRIETSVFDTTAK